MNVRPLVIGIGNPQRGDDGAGRVAIAGLRRRNLDGWDFAESGGDAFSLLDLWRDRQDVTLIDAVESEQLPPGHLVHLAGHSSAFVRARSCSTHGFGPTEALALAAQLGSLPATVRVIGIVGREFDAGMELTPEVRSAVEALVARWPADVSTSESIT